MHKAAAITFISIAARGAHLLLYLVIGNLYGANQLTDSILLLQAPLVIIMTVANGVTDIIVMPAMHRALSSQSAGYIYSRLTRYALVSSFILACIGILIGKWLSPGSSLTVMLLLLPLPVMASLAGIQSGVLHADGRHGRAVLGPLYGGIAAVIFLVTTPVTALSLAASLLVFEVARYTGLRFHANTILNRYRALKNSMSELMAWARRGAIIQALGSFIISMNLFIDYLFARQIEPGAVTLIEYSSRLWNVVPLLLIGQLTIIYSRMSKHAVHNSLEARLVHRSAMRMGAYGVLVSIIAAILAHPAIDLVYGFGTMPASSRSALAMLLCWYLVGAGPFLAGQVYVRAHSAEGNTTIITLTASVSIIINILGNMLLTPSMGINGIGLATAITYTINTLILAYPFYIRRGTIEI